MKTSVRQLKKFTRSFFESHWNTEALGGTPPKWSNPWHLSGAAPNYDKQGVYAFIKNTEVIYIGCGASKGKVKYRGHGLGARLGSYLRVAKPGSYRIAYEKLQDSDHIITIGFNSGVGYLAVALEQYLLSHMPTIHNQNRPGS